MWKNRAAASAAVVAVCAGSALTIAEAPANQGGGAITGVVTTDHPPITEQLPVTQDQGACGDSVPSEVLVAAGGKLANAVVFVEGVTPPAPPPPAKAVLDQQGCRYVPHVQALPVGSMLTVVNSDNVLHNAHSYLDGGKTVFNLAMPIQGQRITKPLRKAGLVDLKCDAGHDWMSGYIHVFDHPWYAVTGQDGTFEIPDVPAGTHTVKIWHEKLGTQTQQITVASGAPARADFKL